MSGECEKCGDHTMDCECNEIRSRKEEFEADLKHLLRTLELLFHRYMVSLLIRDRNM
jgi:hypothetical protein